MEKNKEIKKRKLDKNREKRKKVKITQIKKRK